MREPSAPHPEGAPQSRVGYGPGERQGYSDAGRCAEWKRCEEWKCWRARGRGCGANGRCLSALSLFSRDGDGGAQRGGHGGRTGGNDGQFWARWQDPACRQRSFQWVPFGDCWSESYQETSAKCILHASRERVSNGKFRARRIENILGLVQHATARKVKLDQKLHQKLVCRTRARSSRTRSFRNLRTNARAQLHLNTKTC